MSTKVLHIDDNPASLEVVEERMTRDGACEYWVRHPNDVTEDDLSAANLVLVDYKLDHWPERDHLEQLSLKPRNGLALASLLREATRDTTLTQPKLFALYTSQVADIARSQHPHPLPHVISRAYDLDWIFEKNGVDVEGRCAKVLELARTVPMLSNLVAETRAEGIANLASYLSLRTDAPWFDVAIEDIEASSPPINEMASITGGTAVFRWLSHRVLPYPAFLWDTTHLAARFGVTPESLGRALQIQTELTAKLSEVQYTGALASFLGKRWWRAGVEDLIWGLTYDQPGDRAHLHTKLLGLDSQLTCLSPVQHFVVLGDLLTFETNLATSEEVVEIVPDDWPRFAGPAWTRRSTVALQYLLKDGRSERETAE